jgi:hypothetical protein
MNCQIVDRLTLLQNFWEARMSALERYNDKHPLKLPPLGVTLLLKDIVRSEAEHFYLDIRK